VFQAFRQFVIELTEGGRHPKQFEENDYRLAAAALLVHAAMIDGAMAGAERDKLIGLIQRRFELDDAAAQELVAAATAAEQEAIDLYRFTSVLLRVLDEDARRRLVEMMWQIVYADGRVTEFEDNLIWRASELLGISARERIELKRRVAGEAGGTH
jgi:uncharacterized tellurite resistance protein B-like protein